jgi:hypothetical protein
MIKVGILPAAALPKLASDTAAPILAEEYSCSKLSPYHAPNISRAPTVTRSRLPIMSPEQKFRIHKPTKDELTELGQLVDNLENLIHSSQPFDEPLAILNDKLPSPVSVHDICSYNSSKSRDEFLRVHLTPAPHLFQNLADSEMIWLIEQILQHIEVDHLLHHYSRILEINASVPEGTLFDLPSFGDMGMPEDILVELRGRKRVFRL